jgi:chromosome segregation ATPase
MSIQDTIDQAGQTLQGLLTGHSAAQDAEAAARKELEEQRNRIAALTAALSDARAQEQRLVARYAQASEYRRQWAVKVDQVQNQVDKIKMELNALAKLTQ